MSLSTRILLGMLLGALLGLLLGPGSPVLPQDGLSWTPAATLRAAPEAEAAPVELWPEARKATLLSTRADAAGGADWAELRWTLSAPDLLRLAKKGVQGASSMEAGQSVSAWVQLGTPHVSPFSRLGAGLVAATEWLGRLFLGLIKMVVVPLVFCSLAVGVASLGDIRKLGKLGGRTLGLFLGTTVMALIIGVGLADLIRPGAFVSEADRAALLASYAGDASAALSRAADAPRAIDQILSMIPSNPAAALASGDMLQIIFFALMLGVSLTLIEVERARPVLKVLDGVNEAVVMMVHIAMKLAPYGVAALLFKVVGTTGLSVLKALVVYSLVVVGGLLLHLSLTYGSLVRFGARLPFFGFLGALRPALAVAFSTSSSSATLPVSKECVEENLGVSNATSSFVLPLGATVNMDGTALYQGVAAIFIAQIYGLNLSMADQATVVLSATLASVGAAGVPGAGMITLAMVLTAVGVPTEGLALILGVDRLLDMCRTTINVVGDCSVACVVARAEGEPLRLLSDAADAADPRHGFEGRLSEGQHALNPTESDKN